MPPDDHGVLDSRRRRGTSRRSCTARPCKTRGTFAPGESAHTRTQSLPHPSSAQPAVDSGRRFARGVTRSGDLRCSTFWRSCKGQETVTKVRCGSLPAFSRKGGGYRTARVERSARKAGANASAREPLQKGSLRSRRARIGRSRSCSRVISCCCRSRQTVTGAEKRTHLHFTRSGSVQGRAPSSQLQRTRVRGRERRNTGTLIEAETHVTVLESGCDPRMARAAGDGRHPGSSWWAALHGTLANTVSATSATLASRKRSEGERGGDRGVRGTVDPGVCGRKRRATNLEPPAEADQAS